MFYRKTGWIGIVIILLAACNQKGTVLKSSVLFADQELKKPLYFQVQRGDLVKIKKCTEKVCLIEREKIEGYITKKAVYPEELLVMTIVKEAEVKEEADLLAKTLRTAEQGTRGFLLQEDQVWSLVDFGKYRGWVLMEKLFRGSGPFEVRLQNRDKNQVLEFQGEWYIPSLSAERDFSPDKAFDGKESTFSIVKQGTVVTVTVKNYENENDRYELVYKPPKKNPYKKLGFPREIKILYPKEKILESDEGIRFPFQGNQVRFLISRSEKNWVFLNGFLINILK